MRWYEDEVRQVEQQIKKLHYTPHALFYGSSSIRLWETLYDDFKPYYPLNMGFGGSTLEACVHFFPRVMLNMKPKYMVVYAGDNDLGDDKSPESVLKYFMQLNDQIRKKFGNTPFTYLSVKPSINRWNINERIRYTNWLIKDAIGSMNGNTFFLDIYSHMLDKKGQPKKNLYNADGLHLSSEGYQLWKEMLLTHISSQFNESLMKS